MSFHIHSHDNNVAPSLINLSNLEQLKYVKLEKLSYESHCSKQFHYHYQSGQRTILSHVKKQSEQEQREMYSILNEEYSNHRDYERNIINKGITRKSCWNKEHRCSQNTTIIYHTLPQYPTISEGSEHETEDESEIKEARQDVSVAHNPEILDDNDRVKSIQEPGSAHSDERNEEESDINSFGGTEEQSNDYFCDVSSSSHHPATIVNVDQSDDTQKIEQETNSKNCDSGGNESNESDNSSANTNGKKSSIFSGSDSSSKENKSSSSPVIPGHRLYSQAAERNKRLERKRREKYKKKGTILDQETSMKLGQRLYHQAAEREKRIAVMKERKDNNRKKIHNPPLQMKNGTNSSTHMNKASIPKNITIDVNRKCPLTPHKPQNPKTPFSRDLLGAPILIKLKLNQNHSGREEENG